MMSSEEIAELGSKRVCAGCIGDEYLKRAALGGANGDACGYCGSISASTTVRELADRVRDAFSEHYTRSYALADSWNFAGAIDQDDEEVSPSVYVPPGEEAADAIAIALGVEPEIAEDIRTVLADEHDDFDSQAMGIETEFSEGTYYEPRDVSDTVLQAEWLEFEHSLKTEARFFNQAGASLLASIFADLDTLITRDGKPLVVMAGPDSEYSAFYRAREFQSVADLNIALGMPEIHLGPPPKNAAAGRMNAQGVSVFYGATDPQAALAEIRPPVGAYVLVGSFQIIRPLRLLDLTAMLSISEVGSIFDPEYGSRLEKAMFLKSLHHKLTRPVMPADSASDYLPTQAIADFLATARGPSLDGILFPSVQANGAAMNVVLFHKAAAVEPTERPDGAKPNVFATDFLDLEIPGPLTVHDVWPVEEDESAPAPHDVLDELVNPAPYDPRPATLRLDEHSLEVHEVRRVRVDTVSKPVRRQRIGERRKVRED